MTSNDEPVKQEVKQYKPWQVTMTQWSMTLDIINHAKEWWTSEAWSETIQTLHSKDQPEKHVVKQYKPCPVMMNQWSKKWKNISHAK